MGQGNAPPPDKGSGFDLFAAEQAALARARQALTRSDGSRDDLQGELAALAESYARLIAEYRKLNRLADRREERLRQLNLELDAARAEADRASEAKSAWLAQMSHELRTPLNGVIANLDLLRLSDLALDQRDLADAAGTSAQTLLEIIGDVLDLSKIEAGRLDLERVDFDLPDLVAAVAAIIEPRCRAKGLRFTTLTDPDLPRLLSGDPLRFKQVLINLLGNAVKFTQDGGVFLAISGRGRGDPRRIALRIEVLDTGSGFDPALAERLFEAFAQAGTATARHYGGSGLGLAICRRLVGLMGGEIGCTACPGDGALFWVELDLAVPDSQPEPAPLGLGGRRVAVVSAEPNAALSLQAILVGLGARVTETQDMRDDAAFARADLIVIWGGRAVPDAEALSAICRQGARAVVVITQADIPQRLRLLRAGVTWSLDSSILPATLGHWLAVLASAPRAAPPPDAPALPLPANLPVLVIDDTPMNREIARRQLTALGLTAVTVDNGAEGLHLCQGQRFAAVLTDWAMPGMDGLTFTRRLRAAEAGLGRRTPVICMTAHALIGDAEAGLAAGMDGYLTKPVTLERLRGALAPLLSVAPADPAPGHALDVTRLAEIFGTDDPAIIMPLLAIFTSEAPPLLAALTAAAAQGDLDQLRACAHVLKGMAANVAADALHAAADQLERIGDDAAPTEITARLHAASTAAQTVCAAINRLTLSAPALSAAKLP